MIRGQGRAVAIVCVPCRCLGGSFVPVSELVLASLDGTERNHPVVRLAELMRTRELVTELKDRGVTEFMLIVDDLAVVRSWMLPPHTPPVSALWPALHQNLEALFSGSTIPFRVVLWSELLSDHRQAFEAEVAAAARQIQDLARSGDGVMRAAMSAEMRRRQRFDRETGRGDDDSTMRERAAAQVANYAVQGVLMARWQVTAYVPWTEEEVRLMSLLEPRFDSHVLSTGYGTAEPHRDPWAGFPSDLTELSQELRLYVDDLPSTPGAVRPGLVAPLLDALGNLLRPGTRPRAVRQIRSFNQVLSGGDLNRARVEELLSAVCRLPLGPGFALEQAVKKLFCHLACRYTDEDCLREHESHRQIVRKLSEGLPRQARTHVALALTGSLASAPSGIWHPFLSDIDVMPLFAAPPDAQLLTSVRSAYADTTRPSWLYLNEGARKGVAGLTHDPVSGLFAGNRLHLLNGEEFGKLSRLVAPMRHVGGSPVIFQEFARAHAQEAASRKESAGVR